MGDNHGGAVNQEPHGGDQINGADDSLIALQQVIQCVPEISGARHYTRIMESHIGRLITTVKDTAGSGERLRFGRWSQIGINFHVMHSMLHYPGLGLESENAWHDIDATAATLGSTASMQQCIDEIDAFVLAVSDVLKEWCSRDDNPQLWQSNMNKLEKGWIKFNSFFYGQLEDEDALKDIAFLNRGQQKGWKNIIIYFINIISH